MRSSLFLRRLLLVVLVNVGACTVFADAPHPTVLTPVGREALDAMLRFYAYDPEIPLEHRVVEKTDTDDGVREKFVFRGARGFLVPGYLEAPRTGGPKYPVVLLLHGWSGGKDRWWRDGGYISGGNARKALVGAGCAVLALDAPTHGDRIAENDYALVNDLQIDGKRPHRNYFTMAEIFSQAVVDYRRALDYLATRSDIDIDRVGVLGYSMGGNQAFLLTAAEPRIRVAVSCVVPSMVGEDKSAVAPKDYAQGVGDRPFLMLMGKEDSMCQVPHAEQLFALIPSSRKKLIFYDAGHKLPPNYVHDAVNWLESHLR